MNKGLEYDPNRKWIIEVTEEQLSDIIEDVEDIHRFLAGQTELHNATAYIRPCKNMHGLRDQLRDLQPLVTPELDRGSSYDWAGTHCPNEGQREKIARGYGIYRHLRHCIEKYRKYNTFSAYQDETLTCGVPLAVCYPKEEKNEAI